MRYFLLQLSRWISHKLFFCSFDILFMPFFTTLPHAMSVPWEWWISIWRKKLQLVNHTFYFVHYLTMINGHLIFLGLTICNFSTIRNTNNLAQSILLDFLFISILFFVFLWLYRIVPFGKTNKKKQMHWNWPENCMKNTRYRTHQRSTQMHMHMHTHPMYVRNTYLNKYNFFVCLF